MVELFRAEWMKINGNRFMTSFTVWLFPVGVVRPMSASNRVRRSTRAECTLAGGGWP